MPMKEKGGVFVSVVLGMLTAFGPFVTDFYLPVLPDMAEWFSTSSSAASLSMTMGMLGLALGQLFIGPLTDKYGRKWILVASMVLFCIASVLCVYAPDIYMFNAMRLLQGIGGSGGLVISRSMAADMFSGRKLLEFMALLMAINGVAPVLAPEIGGTTARFFSWRGVFVLLTCIGVVLMICCLMLRETLATEKRLKGSVALAYKRLFTILRHSAFAQATVAMTFCYFAFFSYITSSTFIIQKVYGLNALQFSICFGVNGTLLMISSAMARKFRNPSAGMRIGVSVFTSGAILVALSLWFALPLLIVLASFAIMLIGFGLLAPVVTSQALDGEHDNAGAASAIIGATAFLSGALVSPIVTIGNVAVSTGIVIAVSALLCFVLIERLRRIDFRILKSEKV